MIAATIGTHPATITIKAHKGIFLSLEFFSFDASSLEHLPYELLPYKVSGNGSSLHEAQIPSLHLQDSQLLSLHFKHLCQQSIQSTGQACISYNFALLLEHI